MIKKDAGDQIFDFGPQNFFDLGEKCQKWLFSVKFDLEDNFFWAQNKKIKNLITSVFSDHFVLQLGQVSGF